MRLIRRIMAGDVLILAALLVMAFLPATQASPLLYKNFVVLQDQGRDILCNTYIVQQNDYVYKLFRESGEISQADFGEFLNIFRRINPEIPDLDRLKSGQHILIPLKKISPESLPGQQTGVVSIPFMTISTRPELLKSSASKHIIQTPLSETPLSSLEKAARLLEAKIFNKGVYYFPRTGADDFKLDLSHFPVLELSDHSRTLLVPPSSSCNSGISESDVAAITSFWKSISLIPVDPNAPVESIMEAFFNSKDYKDSENTVSFSDNGVQVTIRARWWINQPAEKNQNLPAYDRKIGFVWSIDPDAGDTHVLKYLAKHGIVLKEIKDEEKEVPNREKSSVLLPPVLPAAPPEALVTALMTSLALPFSAGVPISFTYGGIQIPAVSNLISTDEGRPILVDFGTLYGEAIAAIEESGLAVVRITPQDTQDEMIHNLLTALRYSYETNPTFAGARSPEAFGAEISIPGFLVSRGGGAKVLLCRVLLDPSLIWFLNERGINIVQINEENNTH